MGGGAERLSFMDDRWTRGPGTSGPRARLLPQGQEGGKDPPWVLEKGGRAIR